MATRSHFRGHPTIWINNAWVYEDTGERAGFDFVVRPCKKCGCIFEGSNIGDPDPCLGNLPGVDNACCGHGITDQAYIRFNNGVIIKSFEVESSNLSLASNSESNTILE